MQALLASILVVAVAEIGDKTQLLALILAARFRQPVAITLGILVATLANHAAAGALGAWVGSAVSPATLRWGLGLSFLAVALWALIPDRLDETKAEPAGRHRAFAATLVSFFLVEIGDKTQVATAILAARFDALASVVAGTTIGMLVANVPVVVLGEAVARRVPFRLVRVVAAVVFAALGGLALAGVDAGR
ncbi:MAG TPA: TMEM165/GDT1 family protein [Thermodesulfobacteriota bacterium]